jgi:hypothetical protein
VGERKRKVGGFVGKGRRSVGTPAKAFFLGRQNLRPILPAQPFAFPGKNITQRERDGSREAMWSGKFRRDNRRRKR